MVSLCRHFAAGYFRFRPVVKRSSRLIAHTVEPRMSPFCRLMSAFGGRIQLVSATLSNLTNLRDQEVCHGDVADSVHGSAEGRAMGAMEERAKYCGNLSGAGKEEQDRR